MSCLKTVSLPTRCATRPDSTCFALVVVAQALPVRLSVHESLGVFFHSPFGSATLEAIAFGAPVQVRLRALASAGDHVPTHATHMLFPFTSTHFAAAAALTQTNLGPSCRSTSEGRNGTRRRRRTGRAFSTPRVRLWRLRRSGCRG